MTEEVKKFNEQERNEIFSLALKLEQGVELTPQEKDRWGVLYPRFEALKEAADARSSG